MLPGGRLQKLCRIYLSLSIMAIGMKDCLVSVVTVVGCRAVVLGLLGLLMKNCVSMPALSVPMVRAFRGIVVNLC